MTRIKHTTRQIILDNIFVNIKTKFAKTAKKQKTKKNKSTRKTRSLLSETERITRRFK